MSMKILFYSISSKSLAIFSLCLAINLGRATDVSGKIQLANGKPAKNAVLWLSGGEKGRPLKSAMVDQRDLMFVPHVSVITVGTTVRFPNNDTVYHNVFAEFDAKRFDLGMYPRGSTKTMKFDKPGMVALMCSVHSEMGAYIMVVDTPYFAVADSSGRARIAAVPPGNYVLHVWHESGQTEKRDITVGGTDPAWSIQTKRGG
jgi:plastocyanin